MIDTMIKYNMLLGRMMSKMLYASLPDHGIELAMHMSGRQRMLTRPRDTIQYMLCPVVRVSHTLNF